MKIKSLTIYCSASQKIDKKFFKLARETAEIISNYKIRVVYGGGNVGLMSEIANTLVDLNKEIIGIIPKFLVKKEKLNFKIKKLKVVNDMTKRKEQLFKLGDAFLVLPGGTGTLEEVIEVKAKSVQYPKKEYQRFAAYLHSPIKIFTSLFMVKIRNHLIK